MITAVVRYHLPSSIDYNDCLAHYEKIAPDFRNVRGLISKHFIYGDHGVAGGVYQWELLEDAQAFYSGPWLKGIIERYGAEPEVEYFTVFCITDNEKQGVRVLEQPKIPEGAQTA